MSSEGGGKLRPKRSHAAPPKPYERKKSLFGKVAETVKEIFSPSWLSDLVANINKTPVKEDEEEAENEDKIKDPHETGLLSADSMGPSASFRAYDYDPLRIRSNGQPRNQDFPSQAVSSSLPSTVMSPLNEFTSAQLPLTRLVQKSDSMLVNDDNQSQRSDISKSTSGCSSMIPHPDKRDYQSEVLQEEHSYSDVSVSASASVSTSHHPLQPQRPSDKYQRVPVVEKNYAWTPHSSGIQHSKPQVPANRNQPSFNASLFGSPIQADTSYMEQRFESSFYAGKTTYGGASAYRKARVNNAAPYQSYPVRKQIKPKPTNNTFNAVTSSTARRILEALEKMSTPVNDTKRFPVNDYLHGSFLAQNPSSNRTFSGESSIRAVPGPSGFNSSFTSRRCEVKKGPPLNRIMVPEFATISKNRQKVTSPEVMAKLDARIREENKARTVEVNSWSISHQDTVAVEELPSGASSGKMKRDKSYHKPAKKPEQDDMLCIPDLKTDFTLPLKELPKFQFTPTISGSKVSDSNLQKEKLSPKFTFSSPMKEVQPVEEKHSAPSVRSQEFKFSSPIKVDEEKNSAPSFNFVTITSSSGTSFSTSGCSSGVAVSKPSVASSTERGLILKSPISDTAPRVKEPPKSNVHHVKVILTDPYHGVSRNMKKGSNVHEVFKWSTCPLQPATQLRNGSVKEILGKTAVPELKQGNNVLEVFKWSTSPSRPLQPANELKTTSFMDILNTDQFDGDASASNMKQGSYVPEAFKWSTSPLQPATQLMSGRVKDIFGKTAVPELKQGNNVLEVFKWSTSPSRPLQPANELKTTSFMDILNTDQFDGDASASNMKQGSYVPEAFKWSTSPLQPATQLMSGRVKDIFGKTAVPELKQGNNVLEVFKWSTSPSRPLQPANELKTTSYMDILNTDQFDGDASASNMKQGSYVPEAFKWSTSPLQPATQLMSGRVKDIFGKTAVPNMKQGSNVPEVFKWSTSPLQPATQLMKGRGMDISGKTAAPSMKQGSNVPEVFKWSTSPLQPATQLMTGRAMDILGKTAAPSMKQGSNVPEVFKWSTSPLQPATQLMTGRAMDILGKTAFPNMKQGSNVPEAFKWSTSPLQPATQLMTGRAMDILGKTGTKSWTKNTASDLNQGKIVEALKGSKSPFQPAAQLKAGSVMDILGKTDSSSPLPPSNYLFGKFQPTAGSWKCGVCLIQNKAEDTKCPACQTPKPTAPSKPTPTIGSNLGSMSTPAGSWKCNTCLIQNKAEVNKCAACGSTKPVKSTGSGFGFATTPLVNVVPAGCWKCDTCLIQNKADVNRCAACGSAKPVKSAGSESSGPCPESYLNPFPPGNWICASCLIQNKADAVKCGKCQSDKPAGKSDGVTKTDNSLSDKFKPAAGSWTCNICLVLNNGSSTKCVACETEKPPPKTGDSFMNSFKKPLGTWDCEICLVTNKPTSVQCIACDSPRPGEKPKHLVPSVAGFKIAAGAFSQNSGFNLPSGVAQNESSAPSIFKFGSTSVKSDTTTTPGPFGFKFGDSFQSGTSSEMKTTQSTFKLGDSNTGTITSSAYVVDSQVKKVDSGNSDLKVGGETTAVTVETKSASTAVGGTTDIVFGQRQNVGSNNDLHKENLTTEELNLKPSDSNTSGSSTIKTAGFEFKFTPSSSNQSKSTSFPSSTSTGGSSFNKPTIDSLDSPGQTLSESQRTSGGITTTSQFSTQSNVSNSVTVNKLDSQQSSAPSSKAESLPTDSFDSKSPTLAQANAASDTNKLAVGGFNFMSKSSEESKMENNKPFVFGATANAVANKSIFTLKPSSETSKLKRTNSGEESDAHPGGKRQAMGFGEGSVVNNATGVNASNTSGSTGMFNFGQQNSGTSAPSFLSAGGSTVSLFNPTGFGSSSPAAAPTAAPVFNFTGQNSTPNSSVFTFTGQGSTTTSSPFPAFGSAVSTVSNTLAFGGTSQFPVAGQKDDTSSNMVITPSGSTTTLAFGGFGSSGVTGTTNPASSPFGMGSSNTHFGGNGFGSSTATAPGFGGSSGTSFGVPAPVFVGNTTSPATTTAGFSFNAPNFNSTTQNSTFQFNPKPIDSTPQQQSVNAPSSVFVFGQTPAVSKPQQQLVAPPSSVFVFGQTPADSKPQQQSVTAPSSVFVFGQTPVVSKPQQQSSTAPSSVFVFGQTPTDNKPQQQLVAPPSSVFVFGQTPANSKPQQQSGTGPNSVFVFGQSQTNTSTQVAPTSQGPFNFNPTPVFNFTGSSTPGPYAFSATSSQGENPSSNRKIKKAVRKIRR